MDDDEPLRVACGSGNPVKRRATEAALAGAGLAATVEAVPVDPGVPEQPRDHARTRRGAVARARRALAAGEFADPAGTYGLAVGIEGGVAPGPVDGEGRGADANADGDATWLVMWAAATDGDRTATGRGPELRLPTPVARRVAAGDELGPVMDDLLDERGVARGRGAAGALTGGAIDRESALRHAVACALGPFVTDHYDDP